MDRRGAAGGTIGQKVRRRTPDKPFASDAKSTDECHLGIPRLGFVVSDSECRRDKSVSGAKRSRRYSNEMSAVTLCHTAQASANASRARLISNTTRYVSF